MLDANILIRAVLGIRVRRILENYADNVSFFVPEFALSEAREHMATLVNKRGGDPAKALRLLDAIVSVVDFVSPDVYAEHGTEAKRRIGSRLSERLGDSRMRTCPRVPDLDRRHHSMVLHCEGPGLPGQAIADAVASHTTASHDRVTATIPAMPYLRLSP